jgi:CRP-like cAMP-binding protein
MKRKQERIRELELFGGCRADQVRWVARVADEVHIQEGSKIATEGCAVRQFVVILDGIVASNDGALLGRGEHFGEIELIGRRASAASYVALTPVRALVLDTRAFHGLLAEVPSVAKKLLRELVERVEAA